MSTLFNYPKFKAFDTNGNFLIGGKLWTYQTGTQSLKATFHDKDLAQPHTNPIILDSNGEATIYFSSDGILYDLILTDANDVQLWTMDSIGGIGNVNTSGTVVANEVALFYDSSGSVIKGGLGDTGLIGILELENGITLSDDSGADRLYVKIGDAGAADLTVDDIDCNDIHATGNIDVDGTATVDGIITFGSDAVILTTEDNETAAVKNAGDTDYAYLRCKNIITGDVGHDDYSLLYNGRTDTVIATSGYIDGTMNGRIDADIGMLAIGYYTITFTNFNPLTDGIISILVYGDTDVGEEVVLKGQDPEIDFVFNGTLIDERGTYPIARTYISYGPALTHGSYSLSGITSDSISFSTSYPSTTLTFGSYDGGATWEGPPNFPTGMALGASYVNWISVYVKKILHT